MCERTGWTGAVALVMVALLAPGCGESATASPPSPAENADAPGLSLTADAGCVFAVHATGALSAPLEAAAERWSAATGCEVTLAPGGVLFELEAPILRPDGSDAPGVTSEARDHVFINARSRASQQASSVLHELGHVLGGDHTESDGVLSGQKGRRDVIDAAALASVCARLPCRWLSPEE